MVLDDGIFTVRPCKCIFLSELSKEYFISRRELKWIITENNIDIHYWKNDGQFISELDFNEPIRRILVARLGC